MSNREIIHEGVIEKIGVQKVVVKFISNPACGDCHAKGFCSVPEADEKRLVISASDKSFTTGEKVRIVLSQSHGFRAVFLAYVLPFLLVCGTLFILFILTHKEAVSGVLSLAILLPYYLILSQFRNRLAKEFNLRVMKS
jgi:sigma-E factor negative regulatory protein RseC